MNKQILYLHGRPSAHFLHKGLADSLGVESKFVDEKYRWQDKNFTPLKNVYAWLVNAFDYKKDIKFDFILVDGLHFSPIIAKKIGILPKRIKVIAHMGNQLPFFMFSDKLSVLSKKAHQWLYRNYDFILCEGDMIKELILITNPGLKTPLFTVFTGPSSDRIEVLRKIRPDFANYNLLTIAGGPGEDRVFYKGLDVMIEAVVSASKQLPQLKYYILGNWSSEDIKKLLAGYTSNEVKSISFVGNQSEIGSYVKYIQNSALCLHVSRGDAFPGSTIEVMHAGLPVLISNYTGTKQILNPENSDLIVNISADELSKKIIWYFDLPIQKKADLSIKLKQTSLNWTEERAIECYRETFNKLRNY